MNIACFHSSQARFPGSPEAAFGMPAGGSRQIAHVKIEIKADSRKLHQGKSAVGLSDHLADRKIPGADSLAPAAFLAG